MSDPLAVVIERGWAEVAAAAGVSVTVVLVDAGRYSVTTGDQADARTERVMIAVGGPVSWKMIESGAAVRGDRFVQVNAASLPRAPRSDDMFVMPDGATWKVKSTVAYGAIIEAIIGRS